MKPLKKPTKAKNCPHQKRFEKVCEEIRELLHIEHWEIEYVVEDENPEHNVAERRMYCQGTRQAIAVFDLLWGKEAEAQLRTLIHEHCHVVMTPYDQAVHKGIDWQHDADRRWTEEFTTVGREHVTDHFTGVLYDLIKDRFDNL